VVPSFIFFSGIIFIFTCMERNKISAALRIAGFLGTILLLHACMLNQIVVDVELPPKYNFQPEMSRLAIVSRFQNTLTFDKSQQEQMILKGGVIQDSVDIRIENPIIKGVQSELMNLGSFDIVAQKKLFFADTQSLFPNPIGAAEIIKLGSALKADGLLVLERVNASSDISYSSFSNQYKEDPNQVWSNTIVYDVRKVNYYNATLEIQVQLDWRIYSAVDGSVLFEGSLPDTVYYEVQGNSHENARKKLPSYFNAMNRAGYHAGVILGKLISPEFETVTRYYFRGSPGSFREAVPMVKFRRWKKASVVWENALHSRNKKIKAMASYNLALISEMEGDLQRARTLIDSAANWMPVENVLKYQKILHNR